MEIVLRSHPAADPLFPTQDATSLEVVEGWTGRLRKLVVFMPGHGGFLVSSEGDEDFAETVRNFGFKLMGKPCLETKHMLVIVHGPTKPFELYRTTEITSIEVIDPFSRRTRNIIVFLPGREEIKQLDAEDPNFKKMLELFQKGAGRA